MSQCHDRKEYHSLHNRSLESMDEQVDFGGGRETANNPRHSASHQGVTTGRGFGGPSQHPYTHFHSQYHSPAVPFYGRANGLPSAQNPEYTTPAHSFGFAAAGSHEFRRLGDGTPIEHLIPADPDEEYHHQAGYMGLPSQLQARGTRGPAAPTFVDLVARMQQMEARSEEAENHRVRLEAKQDENTRLLTNIANEMRDSMTRLVPPADLTANANRENGAPLVPDGGNERAQHQPVDQRSTPGPMIQARENTEQDKENQIAGGGEVASETRASAQNKRPLIQNSEAGPSAAAKRAKTAQENAAAAAGPLLPSAGAGLLASFQLRPPVERQPGAPSAPGAGTGPAPFGDDEDRGDQWAWEFLSFLKRMDCTSDKDMLRLKKYVKGRQSCEFPLCTDSPTRRAKFCYFLKVGGRLSTTLRYNPSNRPAQPRASEEEVENLDIFETCLERRRSAAAAAANSAHSNNDKKNNHLPPRYLVPLGEVYRACRSAAALGLEEVASTNFFVFMDVTRPSKSLWLIYRYERPPLAGEEGGLWRSIAFANPQREPVFQSDGKAFDTACLLDDVREWRGPADEMVVDSGRFAAALPRGVRSLILRPVLNTPILYRLREDMKQGWEGPVGE